jgi:uncharacterized membrane protein YphA (DoxX/SURF4 family)
MTGSSVAVAAGTEGTANGSPTVRGWVVVPLWVYLGAAFLYAASNKIGVGKWSHWPEWMGDFITSQAPNAMPLYRPFLTGIVLPHTAVFAPMVAVTEVAIGIALVVGGATRLAASVGILLVLNYFLMKGDSVIDLSNDVTFVVGLVAVIATHAGRTLGVDALLAQRWPRTWLWSGQPGGAERGAGSSQQIPHQRNDLGAIKLNAAHELFVR